MLRVHRGQDERVPDVPTPAGQESSELLGQLARQLSTLVRRDVEVAASERLPTLRRALLDVAAVAAVLAAVMFALGAVSVAGGRAAGAVMAGWAAALVVAAAWTAIAAIAAAVLLRPRAQPSEREEPFGLLQLLAKKHELDELQSSREEARDEAETEVRTTSGALVKALLDEAVEHQLKALPAVAKREMGRAEGDAAELITETLAVLTAPARAGLNALSRLVETAPASKAPTPAWGSSKKS
jgi:hypothetical protein